MGVALRKYYQEGVSTYLGITVHNEVRECNILHIFDIVSPPFGEKLVTMLFDFAIFFLVAWGVGLRAA